jgi:hypothetical protein
VHCGCAKRPFPAKRRPQFISVTVTSTLVQVCRVARNARFRRSVDRNLFRSPRGTRAVHCGCARRPFPAERRPQFISVTVTSTLVQVCRVARNARFRQSVDRNLFRSPRGTRAVHCGCARRPRPAERRPQFISVTVTSTLVQVCRVARNARFRQSVDRNLFRSPCRERDSGSVQPCSTGSTFVRTAIFRSPRGTRAVHCGCARRPRPAECRPQFISVTARDARCALRVCETPVSGGA